MMAGRGRGSPEPVFMFAERLRMGKGFILREVTEELESWKNSFSLPSQSNTSTIPSSTPNTESSPYRDFGYPFPLPLDETDCISTLLSFPVNMPGSGALPMAEYFL